MPPFNASWDTKPRAHFDATLVRVTTDTGLSGYGSGDLMLGFAGHEPLFMGWDPLRIERHYRVLSHIDFPLRCAAGRSTSRSGTWPARSPGSRAGSCSAAWRSACAPTLPPGRCATRRDG